MKAKKSGLVFSSVLLLILSVSCATSSGKSVERTAERDRQERKTEESTPKPPPQEEPRNPPPTWEHRDPSWTENLQRYRETEIVVKRGFRIETYPSSAEIYFDGVLMGVTPYERQDPPRFNVLVELRKQGHQTQSFNLNYGGYDFKNYSYSLDPILGTLVLSEAYLGAEMSVDRNGQVFVGKNPTVIGSHILTSKKFGYEDLQQNFTISEGEPTNLEPQWVPATLRPLSLTLALPHRTAPRSVGFEFTVTTEGSGTLEIYNPEGSLLTTLNLGFFTRKNQFTSWSPKEEILQTLKPGTYKALLRVGDSQVLTQDFVLDYQQNTTDGGEFWSSGSGALYSPRAQTLEPGNFALNESIMGVSGNGLVHLLNNTGLLVGVDKHWEWDFSFSNRIWSDPYYNSFYLTTGVKNTFLAQEFIKTAWYSSFSMSGFWDAQEFIPPTTDPFTNPLGLKAGTVLSLGNRNLTVSLAPELTWAWKGVSNTVDQPLVSGLMGYLRGAIDLKTDYAQFILSGALRTKTFSNGFGLQLPYQAGAEVRLQPQSGFGVNFLSALEWDNSDIWSLFLGMGVSLAGNSPEDDRVRSILQKN